MKTMGTLTEDQLGQLAAELDAALMPGEGIDYSRGCEGDHTWTRRLLGDMGLTWEQIEAVSEELKDLGGGCDCEVVLLC
jgi:hypothetical protein